MPPKKAAKQHQAKKQQQRQPSKKKGNNSDDELLDQLVAQNELVAATTAIIRPSQVPIGRASGGSRRGQKSITEEEENCRLADAGALQKLAEPCFEALLDAEKKKDTGEADQLFANGREFLLKALMVLAGKKQRTAKDDESGGVDVVVRIPFVFSSGDSAVLSVRLRQKAQDILLCLMKTALRMKELPTVNALEAVQALNHFAPDCDEGWELGAKLYHRARRYADAIDALKVLTTRPTRSAEDRLADEQLLAAIEREMHQTQHQMGDTELTCPICLSDCIVPCHPQHCTHVACDRCLVEHSQRSSKCPVCRKPLGDRVPPSYSEQKKYYLDRLDRNLDDAVAWYNLAVTFASAGVDHGQECHRQAMSVMMNALYEDCKKKNTSLRMSPSFYCACEAVRRDPSLCEYGCLWAALGEYWYEHVKLITDPIERRSYTCWLGERYGNMTLFQVVEKALNTPLSAIFRPTRSIALKMMCRDWEDKIRDDSFTMRVNGSVEKAADLCGHHLTANKNYGFQTVVGLTCLTCISDLTLPPSSEMWSKDGGEYCFFAYYRTVFQSSAFLDFDGHLIMAKAWRKLAPRIKDKLKRKHVITQGEIWGRALSAAGRRRDVFKVHETMIDGEHALVDGELVDRAGVLTIAEKYTRPMNARVVKTLQTYKKMLEGSDVAGLAEDQTDEDLTFLLKAKKGGVSLNALHQLLHQSDL